MNDLIKWIAGKWFIQPNRHGSFAPVRPDQSARWYVDGERLMADVADAIEAAADEVFITDWWLVSNETAGYRVVQQNLIFFRLDPKVQGGPSGRIFGLG